jgi:hypothetical protein
MAADEQRPDKQSRRAGELLAHHQNFGEELLGASRAWVARVRPKGHVLFAGRHRHLVALTDQRLVAWRHPKRADTPPAIDVPLSALHLRAEHPSRPFFQVLASADAGIEVGRGRETLVIELRHRDHSFGRALGRALSATTTPAAPASPAD